MVLAGERGGPNKGRKLVLFRHVAERRENELETENGEGEGRKVDRAKVGKEERKGENGGERSNLA